MTTPNAPGPHPEVHRASEPMPVGLESGAPRLGWRWAVGLYAGFAMGVVLVSWPLVVSPATLWPPHHDARVFTWVMASIGRRLLTSPLTLFHGNAFYPFGESLAYTEILLPPALLGLPGFVWGNPVLTYNLLLLTLWPLNGVGMAWVAHALTGSRPAACLAGAVFCLSPYFTEYYLEFQMLLAALLPVVLLAWVRWLETRAHRWLVVALGGLVLEALTTWYYAIILGLGLVTLTVGFLCLRWRGWMWGRRLAALAVGGFCASAVLLPFVLPYVIVHRELGFERSVEVTAAHYADLATFVEPGRRSLLYRFAPSGHIAETSAFAGVSVLALAAVSLLWLRRDAPLPRVGRWLNRAGLALLGVWLSALACALVLGPGRYRLGPLTVSLRPERFLNLVVLVGFGLLLVRGWASARRGGPRRLSRGDWVRLLLLLTGIFAILALGPVIHEARGPVGPGPYLALYQVLPPLRAIRVTARFAVLSIAGLALLAALGLRMVEDRVRPHPWARRLILLGVFLALALEYAVAPARYQRVDLAPRPVDMALRADPDDVVVLEWPVNVVPVDVDAMVRSLGHGKRVVNGLSGFTPGLAHELSVHLATPGAPFPSPEAQAILRRIYPLRYLVVRLAQAKERRPGWLALRRDPPPLLRFRGTFGHDDLYEIVPLPERGVRAARWVSYDFLQSHPVLTVGLRPAATGLDVGQWVDVVLNERLVRRIPLNEPARLTVLLAPPFRRAAPNVIALRFGHRRPLTARDARYRIGTTGVLSPGDLRVVSEGRPRGRATSIQLNGIELAPPHRRGYNLVALNAAAEVVTIAEFDTFEEPDAAHRLARWVTSLPVGTLVAGAVRDEGSARLTEEAVQALRGLGVSGDLRGRLGDAHAFVGVKGAVPGSALEALGPRPIELTVGRPELVAGRADTPLGFDLTEFRLEPSRRDR